MRYIVNGTCMEYIARLCVEAENPEQAKEAWKKVFPDCGYYDVQVWNLDGEESWLEERRRNEGHEMWKGNGDRYYSGGYYY